MLPTLAGGIKMICMSLFYFRNNPAEAKLLVVKCTALAPRAQVSSFYLWNDLLYIVDRAIS